MHQVFISYEHGTQITVIWRPPWPIARTDENAGAKTPARQQGWDQAAFTTTCIISQIHQLTPIVIVKIHLLFSPPSP